MWVNVGVVTANDSVLIDNKIHNLLKKVQDHYGIEPTQDAIKSINYRPFDNKWIYYDTKLVERSREKIMEHFLHMENIGLVYKLGNAEENSVSVMVTNKIIDFRSWSRSGMQGGDYIAPLYLL